MSNLDLKQKLNILIIGFFSSLLLTLIFYAFFAQIIVDIILTNIDNSLVLMFIIIGFLLINFILTLFAGFLVAEGVKETAILRASGMSLAINFLIITVLSYVSLWVIYPSVFSEAPGLEFFIIFPQVIMYFSIYILPHPFYLFILSSFIYHVIYVIFLENYYEEKPFQRKEYKQKYRY